MIKVPFHWLKHDVDYRLGYKAFKNGVKLKSLSGLGTFDIQRKDAWRAGYNDAKRDSMPKPTKPKKTTKKKSTNKKKK